VCKLVVDLGGKTNLHHCDLQQLLLHNYVMKSVLDDHVYVCVGGDMCVGMCVCVGGGVECS
jgi:hypothetical protein